MIVGVRKYLIYGLSGAVEEFFALAQRAGFIEFIGTSHKKSLELPDDAKAILAAVRIAKKHEIHPLEAPSTTSTPVELANKIVELNSDHEQLLEEQRLLSAEISRIAVFGDFSRADLMEIESGAKRVLQFFCMKSSLAREMTLPSEVIYVGTEYDLDYFASINRDRVQYPKMIEILIDRPVGELRTRLQYVRERVSALENDIRNLCNNLPYLQRGLDAFLNEYDLKNVKHEASRKLSDALFAIEAWIPETKVKSLLGLISHLDVIAEEISIHSGDRIPTCMENKKLGRMGEDLVNVYDTPANTDKDPSTWVMLFFTLFFAIITADAGYGLLYLFLGFYLKWKFPGLKGAGRRFIKMMLIISAACIIWGVLTASFFGIEIGPNNPYRKMSFLHVLAQKKAEYHLARKDDVYQEYVKEYPAAATAVDGHDFLVKAEGVKDGHPDYEALTTFYDNILMEVSLIIGILHLSLSFFRYLNRNWSGLGWIFSMIGGYLYFPKILECSTILNFTGIISKETAAAWGAYLLYGGIGLAFVAALFQKKWGAFHEVMNVIQIFADVLSYLRLYALGLAGMIMANTFNTIGANLGILFGTVAIIVGHLSNICVSIMGGVIHGLRLNFLEWYHYSFEGGGKPFNPLKLRK